MHSAKELAKGPLVLPLLRASLAGTRQRGAFSLSAGIEGTRQKVSLYRVLRRHSTKALSPGTVTTTFLYRKPSDTR
jgi:hypothetical protein